MSAVRAADRGIRLTPSVLRPEARWLNFESDLALARRFVLLLRLPLPPVFRLFAAPSAGGGATANGSLGWLPVPV
jgi:hypothetical protein